MPEFNKTGIKGLTDEEVVAARIKNGYNRPNLSRENKWARMLGDLAGEPMLILLFITATIYLISGNTSDGLFMIVSIFLVAAISIYQETKSRRALEKIKIYTKPSCKVIRNSITQQIKSEDVVIGDSIVVEEGNLIPADGLIESANDFSVNESTLTGESLPVNKNEAGEDRTIYQGTLVTSGLAIATVTAIGSETRLGKIEESIEDIRAAATPLEVQIHNFVTKMALAGTIVFLLLLAIDYFSTRDFTNSLLKGLTLAMSILPEEIPVAFTTFMALGSWRLMKSGIVVKQMKTVETLGSATVICTDKTGTLTENRMSLAKLYVFSSNMFVDPEEDMDENAKELIEMSMWASEPIPYDPMELAIHVAYAATANPDRRASFRLVHEYPLSGIPPMMTHVFKNNSGNEIIAAKGAPETIIRLSNLSMSDRLLAENASRQLSASGYRVLGVGVGSVDGDSYPTHQENIHFQFKGLIAFYDPPKGNIKEVLKRFYAAGITVKIITGDNAATTTALAKQIGFLGYEHAISGDELMQMSSADMIKAVSETNLFCRVFPEAKLKIINTLKEHGEVVAMTGDGVNDGPALKAAHIGIAMGKKGTEIAREAASLILLEDDLSKMVDAVAMGRKIYGNLKKAIQYIISIHVPIILIVFLPLVLGWIYPSVFSPVHVIFLELIMGPTCSIVYENEPLEKNAMLLPPRPFTNTFFEWKELGVSIAQGLLITAGSLLLYQYEAHKGVGESVVRTMVFTTLVIANIFLTLVNRSFYFSIWSMLKNKNWLMYLTTGGTAILLIILLYVPPAAAFFEFTPLNLSQIFVCSGTGFVTVIWFELLKYVKRNG